MLWEKYTPLFLRHARVNAYRGEIAFDKQLVQLPSSANALHKDNNLIEVQCIEKVIQLAVFLHLAQFDVVLLQ